MTEPQADSGENLAPSQRRLQRPPDFTGDTIRSFREVFLRHGLPGALLGLLCLLHPDMRALLERGLADFTAAPVVYLAAGLAILAFIVSYAWYLDHRLDAPMFGWMFYLLMVSMWEEWVFRLALPWFAAAQNVNLSAAVVASNVAFGLMHYFTLRWKWQWCLGACLGGLALSRQMNAHFDLMLLIGIHWFATFVNTPRLPGRRRQTP